MSALFVKREVLHSHWMLMHSRFTAAILKVYVHEVLVLCLVLDKHHDSTALWASAAETMSAHFAEPGAALLGRAQLHGEQTAGGTRGARAHGERPTTWCRVRAAVSTAAKLPDHSDQCVCMLLEHAKS